MNKAKREKIGSILLVANFIVRLSAIVLLFTINPILAIIINIALDSWDGTFYEYFLKIKKDVYQFHDKLLDYIYYMGLMVMAVNLHITFLPLIIFLFIYRTVGQFIFFFKGNREIFIYFPNFFEYFILGILVVDVVEAKQMFSGIDLMYPVLSVIFLFKFWHEVWLHHQKRSVVREIWIPFYQSLQPVLARIFNDRG